MSLLLWLMRFVMGWLLWLIILIISLFYSIIFWNWKENLPLDMEIVIKEIAGKTIWNAMTFTVE
jgi:magnesium-transporting ATPase (P-type)